MSSSAKLGLGIEKPRFRESAYLQVKGFLIEEARGTIRCIDEGYAFVDNNPERHRKEYQSIVDYLVDFDYGKRWGSFSLREYLLVMKFLDDQYKLIGYEADLYSDRYTSDQLAFMHPISNIRVGGIYEECEKAGISAQVAQAQILGMATRIRESNWIYAIFEKKTIRN